MKAVKRCSVLECGRPIIARGWCERHYRRWKKYGDPSAARRTIDPPTTCTIPGCERKHYGRGWCRNHYNVKVKEFGPKSLGLPKCTLEECENTHYGKGFCRKHWERWKKHGDPNVTLIDPSRTVADRFAERVDRSGACHLWTGYQDKDGYGELHVEGRPIRAHRLSYRLYHGDIPKGLVVRHRCDNPSCVNPAHLETGTVADNNRDRELRGHGSQGSRNPAAVLNEGQAVLVYEAVQSGRTYKSIADEFGIGTTTVARIAHRKTWREVLDRIYPEGIYESAA